MQFPLSLMGFDFIAEIDWSLTYAGCPARTYGLPENCYPAEDPEWEIHSITLYRDDGGHEYGPAFEATGALFITLANSRDLDEAILNYIHDYISDEYVYDD